MRTVEISSEHCGQGVGFCTLKPPPLTNKRPVAAHSAAQREQPRCPDGGTRQETREEFDQTSSVVLGGAGRETDKEPVEPSSPRDKA